MDDDNIPARLTEIVETPSTFVGLLSSPATTDSIQLGITEMSDTRLTQRQESTFIPIEIDVVPGKVLIVIAKDRLPMIERGKTYSIVVSSFLCV